MAGQPRVAILMGSDSDLEALSDAFNLLRRFGVPHEARVLSAHRTPAEAHDFAARAEAEGCAVVICAAGLAAHLAGAIASQTILPVIGIPVATGPLNGLDALLATVQMPSGVPVATVGIGAAANAALLAVQILARADESFAAKLRDYKRELAAQVAAKDQRLQDKLKSC